MATQTQSTTKRNKASFGAKIKGLFQTFLHSWDEKPETPKKKTAEAGATASESRRPKRAKRSKKARARQNLQKRNEAEAIKAQDTQGTEETTETRSVNPNQEVDPAHRPGHRTFDVKSEFPEATGGKVHMQKSAMDRFADGDRAARVTSPQRRINSPSQSASKRGRSTAKSNHH